jgi:hypothetical protein
MKNYIKYSILFLVPIVLLSSKCKDKEPVIRTLKGRLMNNCTAPYANGLVKLRNNTGGGASFSEDINGNKDFYTDSNGYFEINYKSRGTLGTLYAPYKAIERIPIKNEELVFDMGEVNLNGTVNFVIKLEVNNPYTANDTLVLRDWNSTSAYDRIVIPGPFVAGIIDTVWKASYSSYPITYNEVPQLLINYIRHPYTPEGSNSIYLDVPFCSTDLQEAILVID